MHDHKSVFLVVRSSSEGHLQATAQQRCEMDDTLPKLSAAVYDLPPNYEHLDELLKSDEQESLTRRLHEDEVDFSGDTNRISGALQGPRCVGARGQVVRAEGHRSRGLGFDYSAGPE